ncbi:MAG: C4-type zinc ribbon domain-containing protein [Flavobacteriales bacterium]|jgi:predicted  nucleic acid-binding Zn-ribbon protein|nr:C4-type zinc ribbon domain-containing protein [Flavobacteriales bacterium]
MAKKSQSNYTVEEKLAALHKLQTIDSQLDEIRILRGALPEEVRNLEDEIEGLATRVENFKTEIRNVEMSIMDRQDKINTSKSAIEKYTNQQKNVRNNREYEALSKEIEFQELEIQLAEKHIKEFKASIDRIKDTITNSEGAAGERELDLKQKKSELETIVLETEKDEKKLNRELAKAEKVIDDRLLKAYKRLRDNLTNRMAVVKVERDACGGCYSKIPPQRQLDIATHKKIIVCEHCGRVLIDEAISDDQK